MPVFIIAEAGVNHNGEVSRAMEMIDVAAHAGADAIKFQSFNADKLASNLAEKAAYQKTETGDGGQRAMLKALELSDADHKLLFDHCHARGIEFMSTPFDEDAADMLVALGVKRIKIPSGEITNLPFLRHLARKPLPLILSTGMATLGEIGEALETIREVRGNTDAVTVLHCTSNYPADPAEVNLRAITTIATETGMAIGYSDHTLGLAVSTAAVALGATVIEKHFTLDRALPGPDHRASLSPEELQQLVAQIRTVEVAMGSAEKAPTPSEIQTSKVVRRSVMARHDLAAGAIVQLEDLILLRPATGIAPKHLDELPGRRLTQAVGAGEPLTWDILA